MKGGTSKRGFIGVSIQMLTRELAEQFKFQRTGVLVSQVQKDSPAEAADLKAGNIITAVNGRAIDSPSRLREAVALTEVGKEVEIKNSSTSTGPYVWIIVSRAQPSWCSSVRTARNCGDRRYGGAFHCDGTLVLHWFRAI